MWSKFRLSLPVCLWNYKSNCYETNLSSVVVVHAKMVVKQVPNTNQPGVLPHITTCAKNTILKFWKWNWCDYNQCVDKHVPKSSHLGNVLKDGGQAAS